MTDGEEQIGQSGLWIIISRRDGTQVVGLERRSGRLRAWVLGPILVQTEEELAEMSKVARNAAIDRPDMMRPRDVILDADDLEGATGDELVHDLQHLLHVPRFTAGSIHDRLQRLREAGVTRFALVPEPGMTDGLGGRGVWWEVRPV